MSLHFKINKLGPITNSSFSFKPFLLFSGESNLGKSYCSFLAYYCISLFSEKLDMLSEGGLLAFTKQQFDFDKIKVDIQTGQEISIIVKIEELENHLRRHCASYIGYLTGNEFFIADVEFKLDLSDFTISFVKEQGTVEKDGEKIPTDRIRCRFGNSDFNFNFDSTLSGLDFFTNLFVSFHVQEELFRKAYGFRSIFLPPARAALVGSNFSTTQNIISNAGMYKEFLKDMELLTSAQEKVFEPEDSIQQLLKDLFNGRINNNKGVLSYDFKNDKIPITAAASSIKELAPIFLLLNKFKPKEFSVLFEEPESHLHPSLQIKIADTISFLVNEGAYFQVTTHSDYFLNEINNLIRLHRIKSKYGDKFDQFCESNGIEKDIVLDPSILGSYFFKRRDDHSVEIIEQDVEMGIPFATFEKSVDELMHKSATIEDFFDKINEEL